jgi:hypothetical protein
LALLLLGDYQVFLGDYLTAASSLGIALAFDPFDPEQKWDDRPVWKKVGLLIHLVAVAILFGLGLGLNDA